MKVRKFLAELLYPVDPVEITRKFYKGITPDDLHYLTNLEEGDREAYLAEIYQMVERGKLRLIANKIIQEQVEMSVHNATTMTEVNFGRGTCNGIALFMRELESLHSIYKQQYVLKSEFNKYDIL